MTINEILEKYNIGQTELSRKTGIPLRTIQDWAGGRRTPPEYLPKMIDCWLEHGTEND